MKMDFSLLLLVFLVGVSTVTVYSGNPVFPGFYADPEAIVYNNTYYIFPTFSSTEQRHFDAFSSPDLVHWEFHPRIIDNNEVTWARYSMWAPSVFQHEGKYYFLFSANAINAPTELGGIGIAVSDRPEGPYKDMLGKPLINDIVNGAQPIDQFVFKDDDGTFYMYYGGWGRCNMVQLNKNFTGLVPFSDGSLYKEVTPEGYVEGPFMFKKDGIYYFMWSEGGWTGPDYHVAYAMAKSPFGPFERVNTILQQDTNIATGAGHHSVIRTPGTDRYYIVYHRRPITETDANSRVTCIDEMNFAANGTILPVVMTTVGVNSHINLNYY